MEGDLKHVSAQNLECPICLNIFDDPKILTCSHTFCKGCLARLLESQPDDSKLPCPVCRGVTDVPEGNVDKLQTIIALKTFLDDVKNQEKLCTSCNPDDKSIAAFFCEDCGKYLCNPCQHAHSQWKGFSDHQIFSMKDVLTGKVSLKRRRKCKKHLNEDEEYFCSDCQKYVCFRCRVIDHHEREGHTIMEASEHEDIQQRNIEKLEAKADEKVVVITKHVGVIEEQRVELKEMARKLDESVITGYEEAVRQLAERKDVLRRTIKRKYEYLESESDAIAETSRHQITKVNAVKELVSGGRKIPLQQEALTAHVTLCEELEEVLGCGDPDHNEARHLRNKGLKLSFERNRGENELELGRIVGVDWMCRDFELSTKNSMAAISATPDGNVAVGMHCGGIQIFTPGGQHQKTILKDVNVIGLGFLSGARFVVRNSKNILNLYTAHCERIDVTFETLSSDEGGQGCLTVSSDDHIYVSYRKPRKIQVFHQGGGKAVNEISCEECKPIQLFAMNKIKRLVVNSTFSVHLADNDRMLHTEVIEDNELCSYPAVCHDDSIIIAWVNHDEGLVTIDRYTSVLHHVTTLVTDYQIQKPKRNWYYLQEFQSGELAFCTPDRVYIFY